MIDPIGDFLTTLEVCFHFTDDRNRNKYRIGFCICWLQSPKDFYVDSCGMRLERNALEVVNKMKDFVKSSPAFPKHVSHTCT